MDAEQRQNEAHAATVQRSTFTLAAGQFAGQFKSEFQLGAPTGLWSALGSNWFSGNLSADGSMTLTADVVLLFRP